MDEFMSEGLLDAAKLGIPYMQSPVDDLWSFYYVAQWAAMFNKTNFAPDTHIPTKLANLCTLIAGSPTDHDSGTHKVTDPGLDGDFLARSCIVLRDWEGKLRQLATDWKSINVDGLTDDNVYQTYYPEFRTFTNRGVLELLQLVQKFFPDRLCEAE
jgi:hypothetical protein